MSRYAEHALNIHQHEPRRIAIPLLTRESQKHPAGQSVASRFAVGASLFYASTLGMGGTYLPFFPVWLKAIGVDVSWIGIITAVPSLSRFTVLPFVTAFAERRQILRQAMITLAFAQMLYFLFVSLETFGGDDGMSIDRADFMPIDLWDPLRLYYLIWAALLIVSLLLMVIVRSRFGVVLQAIRGNESRVEAMGLVALRFKITSYVISAMICGLAGTLFASWQEYVSPDIMHWTRSGELMIIIILGGIGTLAGPLIGALAFLLLEEWLPELMHFVAPAYAENWMIIFGPVLIAVVLFARGGLVGLISRVRGDGS